MNSALGELPDDADADSIQNLVFEIGKQHYGKENLRSWFQALYETLLGSSQGPRMGSFFALYGLGNSRRLIAETLDAGS
jgi:lysyl-tRNA synthetase class 1